MGSGSAPNRVRFARRGHRSRPGRIGRTAPGHPLWLFAQLAGLALTAALLAGLVATPDVALDLLWNAAIPVLPATFLVAPALWRNVCPLATLNALPGRPDRGAPLAGPALARSGAIGIFLLALLVPARRFAFNGDGPLLAATVLAVAAVAFLSGLRFPRKAGFCNSVCPVLPVERLYGQRPLLRLPNPRCAPCTLCTADGCLDLSPRRALERALGRTPEGSAPSRGRDGAAGPGGRTPSARWLLTPFGAFAAAFPGFVVGYYTTEDVALASTGAAAGVYGRVLLWSAGSWLATAVAVRLARPSAGAVLPVLAALAVALYYHFASAVVADAWGLGPGFETAVRTAAAALAGVWLVRVWVERAGRAHPAGGA